MSTTTQAYRVRSPFIMAKTGMLAGVIPGRTGWTLVGLYKGALIPADCPEADVQRLLADGHIEAVDNG